LRPLRTGLIEVSDDPEWWVAGFFHSRELYARKSSISPTRKRPRAVTLEELKFRIMPPRGLFRTDGNVGPGHAGPIRQAPRPRACGYPQVFCPTPVERSARTCQGADKSLPSVPASG
jgi:hypothetical protein